MNWEEASCSSTSPVNRNFSFIKSSPIPLGSQGQKKRKILQGRQRNQRILRPWIRQSRGRLPNLHWMRTTHQGMGNLHLRKLLFRHDSFSQKNPYSQVDCPWTFVQLRCAEPWCLQQILHQREGHDVDWWKGFKDREGQKEIPVRLDDSRRKKKIRGLH